MNPVVMLVHNCLELTKRAVASVQRQDIDTQLFILDNDSSDGSSGWAFANAFVVRRFSPQIGVSAGWNFELGSLFKLPEVEHVLVIGNDVWLAPWTYSALLSCNVPFVTGVAVNDWQQIPQKPDILPLSPNPDFSCFLIRREAWEKVGRFDESLFNYCGDTDYHIRAHRMGIPLWKAGVPYYHEASSTTRLAPPEEQKQLHERAHMDRVAFQRKWGCLPGTKEYEAIFK